MRVVLEYYGYTSRCWNNQLFCYDPSSNRWEWPRVGGSVPPPLAAHTTLCCGDAVLLFGGRLAGKRLNDLHVLDMLSLQWTKVPRRCTIPCRGKRRKGCLVAGRGTA